MISRPWVCMPNIIIQLCYSEWLDSGSVLDNCTTTEYNTMIKIYEKNMWSVFDGVMMHCGIIPDNNALGSYATMAQPHVDNAQNMWILRWKNNVGYYINIIQLPNKEMFAYKWMTTLNNQHMWIIKIRLCEDIWFIQVVKANFNLLCGMECKGLYIYVMPKPSLCD